MKSSAYDYFFDRIPADLIQKISYGCAFGDKAYSEISKSEPLLFDSLYLCGLRSRIHEKAVQCYLQNKLDNTDSIQLICKNIGFGNHTLYIYGKNFIINSCHVSQRDILPCAANYKRKASKYNPGDNRQLSFFSPPLSKDYLNIYFIITLYFDGLRTIPNIILPDNNFTNILGSKPIFSVMASEEEIAYQKRIMPKLISEVEKEHENKSSNQ